MGTVPGGSRDSKNNMAFLNKREKDLHRYRDKRQAGEHPPGTTSEAMERGERKAESFERTEKDLRDTNPPEKVAEIKKALVGE